MRDTPTSIMLFAAGFGTRMGNLTAEQPKPMVPVAGRPLVDHALDQVIPMGFETVVANLHYKPEALAAHLSKRGIILSLESPDILETGGGLRAALSYLGTRPVFTMNTDAIWIGPNPLQSLLQAWEPDRMDALLMCVSPDNAVGHSGTGDFLLSGSGHLSRGKGLIYSGAQIIKTDLLHDIRKTAFSLNIVWEKMLKQQRLFGLEYHGTWCDVGQPESIPLAECALKAHNV
jgi:N-acetyl-alpha-D-muramate 1-phosphate uridylyltransferase